MNAAALKDYWHPVARSEDIRDVPVSARLLDVPLVLFRSQGCLAVLHDLCIHRGTPLSLGRLDGNTIVCAYHGWAYAADGLCVRIPSLSSQHGIPKRARVTAYRIAERYGLVWVCLGSPRFPIPPYPTWNDPAFTVRFVRNVVWDANAARVIENFLDVSHFPFVHGTTIGHPDYPMIREHTVTQHDDGFTIDVDVTRRDDPTQTFHLEARTYIPFSIVYRRHAIAAGLTRGKQVDREAARVQFFASSPISMRRSRNFQLTSQNYPETAEDFAEYKRFSDQVTEEDRVIVESQRPEELPLDLSEELHLKVPDVSGVEYRRWLARLMIEPIERTDPM
jgi:phenylpropionate dioxygenase-like ring-hydroxylating dioxygenase large terminal subunit